MVSNTHSYARLSHPQASSEDSSQSDSNDESEEDEVGDDERHDTGLLRRNSKKKKKVEEMTQKEIRKAGKVRMGSPWGGDRRDQYRPLISTAYAISFIC